MTEKRLRELEAALAKMEVLVVELRENQAALRDSTVNRLAERASLGQSRQT